MWSILEKCKNKIRLRGDRLVFTPSMSAFRSIINELNTMTKVTSDLIAISAIRYNLSFTIGKLICGIKKNRLNFQSLI